MNPDNSILVSLFLHFVILSFLAIGGGISAVPEMHRQAVEVSHWMTDRQFADLFTISQAAPGPNFLLVTLIGYHVAGVVGALVATLAMCGPTCVIAFHFSKVWDRFKGARWREAVQGGLVPISVGLVGSTGLILAKTADTNLTALALTVGMAVITCLTRISPLWIFALAGVLGFVGLV